MASLEMNNSITALLTDLLALKKSIASEGLVNTGGLRDSIGHIARKNFSEVRVGPSGVHHKRVTRAGIAQELRNGHLGYIFEYGAPRRGIRPRQWMAKTITLVSGKALDIAETNIDQFLREHNL